MYQKMISTGDDFQNNWNFYIDGVRCSKCVQKLESMKLQHSELEEIRFNKTHNLLTLKSPKNITPEVIIKWIQEKGYQASFVENPAQVNKRLRLTQNSWLTRLAVTFFFTSNLMMFSLSLYFGAASDLKNLFSILCGVLYLPILLYSAIPFYQSAWQSIRSKQFSADLAIVVAFLWGSFLSYFNLFRGNSDFYFDSTASFIFLILLVRFFLYKAQNKIESDLNPSLLFKTSPLFEICRDPISMTKLYHEIEVNDLICMKQNQTIPVDLELQSQQAFVDTSIYSGESLPQLFQRGQTIKAGMVALSNDLKGLATGTFLQSELHQIFEGIFLHRNEKTKSHGKAEIYSQYLLQTVSALSLCLLFFFGFQSEWSEGFRRALALFTIACPCSLALSIPLASVITLKRAMESGLFVKTPLYFEKLQQLKGVIFDKTGTLTLGQMKFHSWDPPQPNLEYLRILLAMEQTSLHPLAKSLTRFLEEQAIQPIKLVHVNETLGVGIQATYQGQDYSISSIKNTVHSGLTGFEFSKGNETLFKAYFKDTLRNEALSLINTLKKMNLEIHILSGDRPDVVEALTKELNLDSQLAHAMLSPIEKANYIKKLQSPLINNVYLMVGDGHNDALALSHADASLAITGCAETSLRATDAYAQKGGLLQITNSLKLSQFYHRLIKQNLGLSLTYNLIAGSMAIAGYIDPLMAAILMPLNSFVVIGATVFAKPK